MKVKIEDLSITFDNKKILDHLNLEISEGEFVAILGPSGCGKSTLLNIIAGILKPETGNVYVDEKKVKGISSDFAYMPQEDLLLPWQTILDNVTLYGKLHHKKQEAKVKALQEMETFGLKGYEYAYPHELSGGMRQRAAFLRTALCDAKMMLLDEPFGALDVITRNEMQDWLLSLRHQWNRSTLLVTHDIDEALYLADRIIILSGKPATITKEINLHEIEKSRDWLFMQSDLKKELYHLLEASSHA